MSVMNECFISEVCPRDKKMVCVILLLGLLAHLGEACAPGNGQGPGKGDLLSFSGRKCLFAHSVCANFGLNAHSQGFFLLLC